MSNASDPVAAKVLSIFAEYLCMDASRLRLEARVYEDLGLESLDMIEIEIKIENEFDVVFLDAEFHKSDRIIDAIEYVREYVNNKAA